MRRVFAAFAALAMGGCELGPLVDPYFGADTSASFLGPDQLELRANDSVSFDRAFAEAEKACGSPVVSETRETRPDEPGVYFMRFRCMRPAQFPPPRDNHPLPEVLRQP